MSSGGRVSIPNNVRKTIQNIKEITGNHSEDEIYAMLKDCSMDPNETVQKLLLQDPFHEVKRKRDRKKETLNKESMEPRWKPGMQGRGNRGGRGNYSSRYISQDAGGSRNVFSAKENGGINQGAEDGLILHAPHDKKNKETSVVGSSSGVVTDGPSETVAKKPEANAVIPASNLEGPLPQAHKSSTVALAAGSTQDPVVSSSTNVSASKTPSPAPRVYLSASDPILMPSQDSRLPVGTIRREFGSQRTTLEQFQETPVEIKSAPPGLEVESSLVQGKASSEFQGDGNNSLVESTKPAPSAVVSSSMGRPSSNYNNRPQQTIGSQKVGLAKEWKPKPTNPVPVQRPGTGDSVEAPAVPVEAHAPSQPAATTDDLKDVTSEIERKLEESGVSDGQHVIIPNHLHVPEAEKLGFCFGSFDASFGLTSSSLNGPVNDKTPSLSEASEGIDESTEEQPSRNQDALATADEGAYPDRPPSSENLSAEGDASSSVPPDHSEPKQETSLPSTGHQYPPTIHTSPNLSFGFVSPMIGSQLPPFENSESQVRDGSRMPSYIVQQPFDPASYYAQFYRSGADSDGRISPFHSPAVATKYNGNVTVLPPQGSQSSQEVGSSLISSTAGPAAQAAGIVQNSIAVTQQPLPMFRQPTGLHLPHYPPNYIPYAPYFSPFYVPSPAIHQFLANSSFPQPPQTYPAPPTAKYPLPQFKPGSNTGNLGHIGMAGAYGPYGSSPAGYNPNSAAATGNSTSDEDLGASQLKESNLYITGQQSEGSGVWIAAPSRDISGLPANSFYNLPQGGQVAYTPSQATHGTFANIYHHAPPVTSGPVHPLLQQPQTVAGGVDMVGPTSAVYQQPQPTQINWPSNY